MQYRQDMVTRVTITPVELITILIVTIQSIWHNPAADYLRFGKFPIFVAPPTNGTMKLLAHCKAHPVL